MKAKLMKCMRFEVWSTQNEILKKKVIELQVVSVISDLF